MTNKHKKKHKNKPKEMGLERGRDREKKKGSKSLFFTLMNFEPRLLLFFQLHNVLLLDGESLAPFLRRYEPKRMIIRPFLNLMG